MRRGIIRTARMLLSFLSLSFARELSSFRARSLLGFWITRRDLITDEWILNENRKARTDALVNDRCDKTPAIISELLHLNICVALKLIYYVSVAEVSQLCWYQRSCNSLSYKVDLRLKVTQFYQTDISLSKWHRGPRYIKDSNLLDIFITSSRLL